MPQCLQLDGGRRQFFFNFFFCSRQVEHEWPRRLRLASGRRQIYFFLLFLLFYFFFRQVEHECLNACSSLVAAAKFTVHNDLEKQVLPHMLKKKLFILKKEIYCT